MNSGKAKICGMDYMLLDHHSGNYPGFGEVAEEKNLKDRYLMQAAA